MTKADFRDWLTAHGCTFEPLPVSTSGNAIKVYGKITNRHTYIDMPFDERLAKPFFVCKTCLDLGIPIPDECKSAEPLAKEIKKKHYPNR